MTPFPLPSPHTQELHDSPGLWVYLKKWLLWIQNYTRVTTCLDSIWIVISTKKKTWGQSQDESKCNLTMMQKQALLVFLYHWITTQWLYPLPPSPTKQLHYPVVNEPSWGQNYRQLFFFITEEIKLNDLLLCRQQRCNSVEKKIN